MKRPESSSPLVLFSRQKVLHKTLTRRRTFKPYPQTISKLNITIWEEALPERLNSGSVVGPQPAVLLLQPLDLLHQRLVHRVFLDQAVDLILKHNTSDAR